MIPVLAPRWQERVMKNTILVFGGSGFVGTHLLPRLRQVEDANIASIDLRTPTAPVTGVKYEIGDVRNGLSEMQG